MNYDNNVVMWRKLRCYVFVIEIEGVRFEDLAGAAALMQHLTNLSYISMAGIAALALAFTA